VGRDVSGDTVYTLPAKALDGTLLGAMVGFRSRSIKLDRITHESGLVVIYTTTGVRHELRPDEMVEVRKILTK